MRLQHLIDRITAQCPGFAHVGHGLQGISRITLPAAVVLPVGMVTRPSPFLGAHSQMVLTTFGVHLLFDRARDGASDLGAADQYDDLLAALRSALSGWTPNSADFSPLNMAGGRFAQVEPGTNCWREDFSTETEMRIA